MTAITRGAHIRVPASEAGRAAVVRIRRMLESRPGDETRTIQDRRAEAAAASATTASRIPVQTEVINGVHVERHHPPHEKLGKGLLLFAHGGAFVTGSAETHRGLASGIAAAAAMPLISIDYRLAPEWPFPAGRDDVVTVYAAMIKSGETAIGLVGDSAGGGLMMQAALAIRDAGLPSPAFIALLSPWVDFRCEGASHEAHRAVDLMLSRAGLIQDADRYLGARQPDDPAVSPLHADLNGLPRVLIQVGELEILADDAVRLSRALSTAGVAVELQVWEGMTHAWYAFRNMLPEADAAIDDLGSYVSGALEG